MHVETHWLDSEDGLTIGLRERSAEGPDVAVVFVHGATYAGRPVFDPRGATEYSWLQWVAEAGGAGCAVDLRGYGDSERPSAMDAEKTETLPARARDAKADVRAAIGAVTERFSCPIHLVATSWGTMVTGAFLTASDTPTEIASVTFHAPVFEPGSTRIEDIRPDDLPPTRRVTRSEALSRWDDQTPTDPPAAIREGTADDDPVFDAFWGSLVSSGQGIGGTDEGGDTDADRSNEDGNDTDTEGVDSTTIVAPNGTLADLAAASDGNPPYDPGAIDVPTLVVRGSLDPTSTREDALRLYDRLSIPDDESAYTEIAGGTHFLHLERRRKALYRTVDAFQAGADGRDR